MHGGIGNALAGGKQVAKSLVTVPGAQVTPLLTAPGAQMPAEIHE